MVNRPVHFEVYADDPERAMAFYRKAFGWTFQKYAPVDYWLVTTGPDGTPGINGGLAPRKARLAGRPAMDGAFTYIVTIDVANIDEAMKTVVGAGATAAVPKVAIPGVGWSAYFQDTEGNFFGLFQTDTKAK
jgi:predicted enzyme related to lactoylglutathione lyase